MLRWSFMLFILAVVEGGLSHSGSGEGSALIAKISLVLAACLFILFQRVNYQQEHNERKA